MLNSVTLVGRLTRDPELRHTNNDRPVCELRLAVDGRGEEPACFIGVVTFDAGAQACSNHLVKGRMIGVTGRLILDEWTTDSGDKRSRHRVIGQVKFLPDGSRPTPSEQAAEVPEPAVA